MSRVRIGLFLVLGLLAPAAMAAKIGVVTSASGEVKVLRGDTYYAAARGVDVHDRDVIQTGDDSAAQLEMIDGTMLKLGAETKMILADYKLNKDRGVISAGIEILEGWVRFAVKKVRGDGKVQFNTPVMTIGVRGTEGVIDADDEEGGLVLDEGEVEVVEMNIERRSGARMTIRGGESVGRRMGQPFQRHRGVPPQMADRLPPMMRKRLAAMGYDGKQPVTPRMLHKMRQEEVREFMKRHRHMQKELQRHFREQLRGRPGAGPNRPPAGRPGQPPRQDNNKDADFDDDFFKDDEKPARPPQRSPQRPAPARDGI